MTRPANSWATRYIGQPWEPGHNDCWAFARRVWHEQFGWVVPPVYVDALNRLASARAMQAQGMYVGWETASGPTEGSAVVMSKGRHASHVGVWTQADGGGVVHSVQGMGVVFTPLPALAAMGLKVLAYYRRAT